MGLSQRAYARHKGVAESSVRKAVKAGRITPLTDGTLDPATADLEWARNTDSTKTMGGSATGPVRTPDSSGTTLLQARTVHEVTKAQMGKVKLSKMKGELIDRSQAIALVFQLARAERDSWSNWPGRVSAQMAANLNVDAHSLHIELENAVRDHLTELGNIRPRVD